MTVRPSAPLGAPTWIDLATSDVERAREFYATVFGWSFEEPGPDYGGYVNASLDGHLVAGLMPKHPEHHGPDTWTTYLHTADIDATLAEGTKAGGTNCGGVMDIPAKGRMAVVTDPAGGFVGLWEPSGHPGFQLIEEPGAPAYFQLTARDYRGALDFYQRVFGWQLETAADTDDFRYTTAMFDGVALLGVMDGAALLPEGAPSEWTCFLSAEDVDKTIELVVEHGGSVVRAAEDTPYGRLAAVTDPTGAGFNLTSWQG